jgi:predicted nucleic acid-binding protein
MAALVFDTSVLSAFARARRLELLDLLTAGHRRVTTRAVIDELERGCPDHPELRDALAAPWIEEVPVETPGELRFFAEYSRRLVAGERNIGEASVLAWAEAHQAIAIVDDQAAVQCGRERGVEVRRTLALVARGVKRGVMEAAGACKLVDELVQTGGARFPCSGEGFVGYARREGLLGESEKD